MNELPIGLTCKVCVCTCVCVCVCACVRVCMCVNAYAWRVSAHVQVCYH